MTKKTDAHQASFRDPSGHVFYDGKTLRRAINPIYFPQYNKLKESGFFKTLFSNELLIPHEETSNSEAQIIITPEPIPFITNPYEWSFEQYKHAALHTLKIQKYALSKGFILKDASAYKQFITHFFGPLVLAKYHGAEIFKMMQTHIDGIPVKLISSLLPSRTKLSSVIYPNIHLLAKMESKYSEDYKAETKIASLSKKSQENIIESLYDYIKGLTLKEASEWGDYYNKTN